MEIRRLLHCCLLILLLSPLGSLSAQDPTSDESPGHPLRRIWLMASRFLAAEAMRDLDRVSAQADLPEWLLLYTRALLTLNLPTRSVDNTQRAAALFEQVARHPQAPVAWVVSARYYLARIDEVHWREARPQAAARAYHELYQQYPEQPKAQLAAVRACMIDLYALEVRSPDEVIAEATQRLERFTDPVARQLMRSVLADAHLRFTGNQEQALHFLLSQLVGPFPNENARGSVMFRAGRLAHALGYDEQAAELLASFAREFPRHVNAYEAHLLAQAISAKAKGGPAEGQP